MGGVEAIDSVICVVIGVVGRELVEGCKKSVF